MTLFPRKAQAYPEEYTQRPQTLPANMIELGAGPVVDLSAGRSIGGGIQTAFRWGVADGFELTLEADAYFRGGLVDRRTAPALRATLWHSDTASIALDGGLDLHLVDTVAGAKTVDASAGTFAGVSFYTMMGDRFALRARLAVYNPLFRRDILPDVASLSLEPSWNITSNFAALVRIDLATAFQSPDAAVGGLSAGVLYTLDNRFDFGATFALPALVSKGGLALDARVISAFVRWRIDAR